MKALSFWAPWPDVIFDHGKRIENRERWSACYYRGPILIHAAKSFGGAEAFDQTIEWLLGTGGLSRTDVAKLAAPTRKRWTPHASLQLGGIVGVATIDGTIKNEGDFARFAADNTDAEAQRKWWFGGFALVLRDVRRIPFVPWAGKQGFFEVPESAVQL